MAAARTGCASTLRAVAGSRAGSRHQRRFAKGPVPFGAWVLAADPPLARTDRDLKQRDSHPPLPPLAATCWLVEKLLPRGLCR